MQKEQVGVERSSEGTRFRKPCFGRNRLTNRISSARLKKSVRSAPATGNSPLVGDVDSYHKLAVENFNFAKNIASRFHSERSKCGIDMEEFEGAALIGLCDAARRFDPNQGCQFMTYAYRRIVGAMYDLMRRGGPISHSYFTNRRHSTRRGESKRKSGELAPPDLSGEGLLGEHGDRSLVITNNPRELASMISSIDALGYEIVVCKESNEVHLVGDGAPIPDEVVIKESVRRYLGHLISELPDVEKSVVQMHYFQERCLEEIGRELDIGSKATVCRVNKRALHILREGLLDDGLEKQDLQSAVAGLA
jgi:RNA polymerase sigma factor FliA